MYKRRVDFDSNHKGVEWGTDELICPGCSTRYRIRWTRGKWGKEHPDQEPTLLCPRCHQGLGKWPVVKRLIPF
jgi:uncharacterized protein YbaR (Trm112 family)